MLAQGTKVAELEEKFTATCQVKHAVACTSGTVALHMALLAHGIGEGDEVITTPFSFIATANSILYVGAKPVFVDIDEQTFNLNPELVEAAITPRTKAIMPVHLYGHLCDMDLLMNIAKRHNLAIIEDAAQSVGSMYKGKVAGSFGTGCFSLYATKNVMSAEGGMLTTNDTKLANKLRLIRNHGMEKRYHHEFLGYNFRMTNVHAAIGVVQMGRLATFTEKRQRNAVYLNQHIQSVITPDIKNGNYNHVWHQYTVKVPETASFTRDGAVEQLREKGIGTGIFYPIPIHHHAYIKNIVGKQHFPVTEKLTKQVFSLPVHPQLTQKDLETIVKEVNDL